MPGWKLLALLNPPFLQPCPAWWRPHARASPATMCHGDTVCSVRVALRPAPERSASCPSQEGGGRTGPLLSVWLATSARPNRGGGSSSSREVRASPADPAGAVIPTHTSCPVLQTHGLLRSHLSQKELWKQMNLTARKVRFRTRSTEPHHKGQGSFRAGQAQVAHPYASLDPVAPAQADPSPTPPPAHPSCCSGAGSDLGPPGTKH